MHWSQSGRRSDNGSIVLIEVLQVGNLGKHGESPDHMMWFWQQFFRSAVELEHDRLDTDASQP